jgi:hypothetical protein
MEIIVEGIQTSELDTQPTQWLFQKHGGKQLKGKPFGNFTIFGEVKFP